MRLADNLHHDPLTDLELAEAFERIFLRSDAEKRAAVREMLGLDEQRLSEILETLRSSNAERERVIYGVSSAARNRWGVPDEAASDSTARAPLQPEPHAEGTTA